jgi:hypothetical protein
MCEINKRIRLSCCNVQHPRWRVSIFTKYRSQPTLLYLFIRRFEHTRYDRGSNFRLQHCWELLALKLFIIHVFILWSTVDLPSIFYTYICLTYILFHFYLSLYIYTKLYILTHCEVEGLPFSEK